MKQKVGNMAKIETYRYRDKMLVQLDCGTADDFFEGLTPIGEYHHKGYEEKTRKNQEIILSRLKEKLPGFFDEKTQLGKDSPPNYCRRLEFFRQFEEGWFKGEVMIRGSLDLLLEEHHPNDDEAQLVKEFASNVGTKPVVAISGDYWLGAAENKKFGFGILNPYEKEFPKVIECRVLHNFVNALCQGVELTQELITNPNKKLPQSFKVYGTGLVVGCVKDYTIAGLNEADAPVGEFMQWISEHENEVRTTRRLAVMAAYQAHARKSFASLLGQEDVIMNELKASEDRYVELALTHFSALRPPSNQRLKYLIT